MATAPGPDEIPIIFTSTGAEKAVADAGRVGASLNSVSNRFSSFERAATNSGQVINKVHNKIFASLRGGGRAWATGAIANLATGGTDGKSFAESFKQLLNPQVFAFGMGNQIGGGIADNLTKGLRNKGMFAGLARVGLNIGGSIAGGGVGLLAGTAIQMAATNAWSMASDPAGFYSHWNADKNEIDLDLEGRNKNSKAAFLMFGDKRDRIFAGANKLDWKRRLYNRLTFDENQSNYHMPEGYTPHVYDKKTGERIGGHAILDKDVITGNDDYNQVLGSLQLINNNRARQINASGQVGF